MSGTAEKFVGPYDEPPWNSALFVIPFGQHRGAELRNLWAEQDGMRYIESLADYWKAKCDGHEDWDRYRTGFQCARFLGRV